ncbi:MAG: zinc-binding dehydrogenase [Saprospiraceae bacterium]|nr:zinc-binding dehydrogenase [Saprospiraceae bacterium]
MKQRLSYFLELKELLRTTKIKTVIDASYPLAQIAVAHAYVEKGHKRGSIIIAV